VFEGCWIYSQLLLIEIVMFVCGRASVVPWAMGSLSLVRFVAATLRGASQRQLTAQFHHRKHMRCVAITGCLGDCREVMGVLERFSPLGIQTAADVKVYSVCLNHPSQASQPNPPSAGAGGGG